MKKIIKLPKVSRKIEQKVQKELERILREYLYKPLIQELGAEPKKVLKNENTKSPLLKFIKTGRIYFYRGQFKGKFNASISKELRRIGAKYNKKQGSYDILASNLPQEIIEEIRKAEEKFDRAIQSVARQIDDFNIDGLTKKIQLEKFYKEQIDITEAEINKQVKGFTTQLTLTEDEKIEISEQYNNNMKLYIQEWTEKEIVTLRETTTKNVKEGIRYEEIIKGIQDRYGVAKSKAKFLARQETNLLTTKLGMQRAKKAGATHYIWRNVIGSAAHPVRPSHKALNGEVIAYDDPPIVDQKTSRKAHAGEDFNCYHKETAVYTKEGFKKFTELNGNEEILTLNPSNNNLEYATIKNFVSKKVDKIYNLKGRSFNLSVDKNHVFFVHKTMDRKPKGEDIKPCFVEGLDNLAKRMDKFYKSSEWSGSHKKHIRIGGLEIPINDYCILMGYYLSEGSVDNRAGRNGIKISQQKHIDIFYKDLEFFKPKKGKDAIWIFSKELKEYLSKFGYSHQKYVPDEIKELSKDKIRIFLDAFCLGDGSPKKKTSIFNGARKTTSYNKYYTSSPKLRDGLIECIIKTGMAVTTSVFSEKGKITKHRNGDYAQNHDLYYVNELKNVYSAMRSIDINEEEYNDYVYDIEVSKNNTLLIKYGNNVHWNSNCRCFQEPIIEF